MRTYTPKRQSLPGMFGLVRSRSVSVCPLVVRNVRLRLHRGLCAAYLRYQAVQLYATHDRDSGTLDVQSHLSVKLNIVALTPNSSVINVLFACYYCVDIVV